jgi:hypothetical protein
MVLVKVGRVLLAKNVGMPSMPTGLVSIGWLKLVECTIFLPCSLIA